MCFMDVMRKEDIVKQYANEMFTSYITFFYNFLNAAFLMSEVIAWPIDHISKNQNYQRKFAGFLAISAIWFEHFIKVDQLLIPYISSSRIEITCFLSSFLEKRLITIFSSFEHNSYFSHSSNPECNHATQTMSSNVHLRWPYLDYCFNTPHSNYPNSSVPLPFFRIMNCKWSHRRLFKIPPDGQMRS